MQNERMLFLAKTFSGIMLHTMHEYIMTWELVAMLRRPSAYSLVVALIVLAGSFAHANEHAETTMHDASAWEHREIHVAFPALPPLEYDIDIAVTIETELQQTVLHMMGYLIQYGNVEGDYNVTLQTDDILSITLRYSGYHHYMAHPAHIAHSLTFDMTTGQRLALADLFQDEQYIDVLSDYITE